ERAHSEDGEERQLAPSDAQSRGRRQTEHEHEPDERPGRPHLGESKRREPGGENHLRDDAVDRPERRRPGGHRVTEPRPPVPRRLDAERGLDHPGETTAYTGASTGRSSAW